MLLEKDAPRFRTSDALKSPIQNINFSYLYAPDKTHHMIHEHERYMYQVGLIGMDADTCLQGAN